MLLPVTSATFGSQIQNPVLNNIFHPSMLLTSFLPCKLIAEFAIYLPFKYSSRRILFCSHLPFVESMSPKKFSNCLKRIWTQHACEVMLGLNKRAKHCSVPSDLLHWGNRNRYWHLEVFFSFLPEIIWDFCLQYIARGKPKWISFKISPSDLKRVTINILAVIKYNIGTLLWSHNWKIRKQTQ